MFNHIAIRNLLILVLFVGLSICLGSCGGDDDGPSNEGLPFQRELDDKILNEYFTANGLSPTKTSTGLYYIIHDQGTGAGPNLSDTVNVHYTGRLLNDDLFDTSLANQDDPAKFLLGGTVVGFQEGLQLIGKGGNISIYMPSHLAYGVSGTTSIPSNANLTFDVELFDF